MAGKRTKNQRFIAVDLYSGIGGLSLGLGNSGFDVQVAVEINSDAADTYRKNHPDTTVLEKDIRKVTSTEILSHCTGPIDLIAGCAPCQGFCSLTAKNKHADPRNFLVLEMLRLVRAVRPKMVFMENVPGIETRGKRILNKFIRELKKIGYEVETRIEQMADYGIPQSRRRFVLLAGLGFKVDLPTPTYSKRPDKKSIKKWKTIKDVIGQMPIPVTVKYAAENGGAQKFNWHVVRDLKPDTLKRLDAAIPGKSWTTIDESLRPECHQGDYDGFSNVYGRMTWDNVSPTITRGCTTPCHGRFGHPNKTRTTISVREAAIIQTFPRNYRIGTDSIQAACEMIGNAVPPKFAKAVGKKLHQSMLAISNT